MDNPASASEITDKRLLRGARTRQIVLGRAVDIASLENLESLSFGRLAMDVGLSKAGIQTLFRTKETLQLATVDHARRMFIDAVVRPAQSKPHGAQRLRELIDRWIDYAEAPCSPAAASRPPTSANSTVAQARYKTRWQATSRNGSTSSPTNCAKPSSPAKSPTWTPIS